MARGWRVVHLQLLELAWMVLGYWKWWVMVQVKAFEVCYDFILCLPYSDIPYFFLTNP